MINFRHCVANKVLHPFTKFCYYLSHRISKSVNNFKLLTRQLHCSLPVICTTSVMPSASLSQSWVDSYHPGTLLQPLHMGGGTPTFAEDQGEQLLQQGQFDQNQKSEKFENSSPISAYSPLHPIPQQVERRTAKGIKLATKNQFMSEADWQVAEALLDNEELSQERCSRGMHDLGSYKGDLGPVRIPLIDELKRIFYSYRRRPIAEIEITMEKCKPLEENKIITDAPPGCNWAADNVVAKKKDDDGTYTSGASRFCHNYKPINENQELDRTHALPLAIDLQENVGSAKFFSKLDLRSGFMQIPIAEADQPKTAFWMGQRLMMYRYMPFGMKNSPVEFQKRMDQGIDKYGCRAFACCFIDDVLVYSNTFQEHCQHVQQVLQMLQHIGLKYHVDKNTFFCHEIEYLGHVLSHTGLTPCQARIKSIRDLKEPTNVPELRNRLGLLLYYSCYYDHFAATARPLYDLLSKNAKWVW